MTQTDRRVFLRETVSAGAVGAASIGLASVAAADAASGRATARPVTVGLAGCGGRGLYLAGVFGSQPNVSLRWVCDPDSSRLVKARAIPGHQPHMTGDLREMLRDDSLDAVIIATPDHWHAPAAILACDAGRHVYVEKPCSHTIREGRLLVEAARRNKRIVQHGTQVRSTDMMIDAVRKLREGIIGDVKVAKAWNIQRRGNIGRQQPGPAPASLDYDTWVGPAPMIPYQSNRVHHGWHWWHHFGTGDMGNDGVHDIDYARWGLGVETHPSSVSATGGKYFFDDDQEFPDTQQVSFEYPGDDPHSQRMLIYEQRLWSTNYPHNVDSGVEFYGTRGQMFLSRRGKVEAFGDRNQRIRLDITPEEQNAEKHVADFLDCIRTGRRPNGEIEQGHLTASLCHLGNIATRLGRSLRFDPDTERIQGDAEADALVSRKYRDHWGKPVERVM